MAGVPMAVVLVAVVVMLMFLGDSGEEPGHGFTVAAPPSCSRAI